MPHPIKPSDAIAILVEAFALAEDDFRDKVPVIIPAGTVDATARLFASKTAAYRQALAGCAVARIINPQIDIRYPATEEGPDSENSYSGRSLDEGAVMPFLRDKAVPILNASAYLGPLRGGAKLIEGGEPRIQRDKENFDALVAVVDYLHGLDSNAAKAYLRYLLRCFIELRESGNITLKKIAKPNLEQLGHLIGALLTVKSGGRIPALLSTAMFQTLSDCHALGWEVEFQGINVADKVSGAVGDITIRKGGKVILGVEVTERPVNQARVKMIFDQKVSPGALADYLFITTAAPETEAKDAARNYTGVGHEMNFVPLAAWIIHNLATIGPTCRALFQAKMLELMSADGVPAEVKLAWNAKMDEAIGVKAPSGS